MRAFTIRRGLDAASQLSRLLRRNPSLSVRTLHNNIGAGHQTHIMFFEGRAEAIVDMKRRYLARPPAYMDALEILHETKTTAHLFCVERTGEDPLDLAVQIERHLGTGTVSVFHKSIVGSAWHFVTANEDGVPRFLDAVARMEQAWMDDTGRSLPRYELVAWGSARNLAPTEVTLSPMEETILAVALRMGYYEQPKRCRLADIGRRLDLPATTVHYRLNNAERKVLGAKVGLQDDPSRKG